MNILDENILENQRQLLKSWRIQTRQIGYGVGRKGMTDQDIIPLLPRLHDATFFTMDEGFYRRELCHPKYGLVFLAVRQTEAAVFARRLLRHPEFDSVAKRMGAVIRVSALGLSVWQSSQRQESLLRWSEGG